MAASKFGLLLLVCLVSSAHGLKWFENFGAGWADRWFHSKESKYSGKFVTENPPSLDEPALKVPESAKHYGIAALLDEEVDPSKGLVLQYDLKLSEGLSCGGAYLKFLTKDADYESLKDDTPYTVMFGPDKCGATNKVHLIIRHKSPLTGKIEEKHLINPPTVVVDKGTHVYTAVLKPDNTYEILIDDEVKKSGSLFNDFEPPFVPPEVIPDPEDKKPEDWVDEAKIADPEATKPDDWDEDAPLNIPDEDAEKPEGWLDDEPMEIPDPDAKQPEDWDEEEDGEWEAPMVPNPKCSVGCGEWKRPMKPNPNYKGKWSAPLIDNPDYKGEWKPRDIPNPDFYNDTDPLKNIGNIGGVAIEIWTMDKGYYFDDILVTDDADIALEVRQQSWEAKKAKEEAAKVEESEDEDEDEDEEDEADKSSLLSLLHPTEILNKLFTIPFLKPHKKAAKPVLDFVKAQPHAFWTVLAIPTTLLLLTIRTALSKKKATAPVTPAVAKKRDVPQPDDKPVQQEGVVEEDQDDDEEEEEEEEEDRKEGTRRRTRRDK